MSKGICAIDTCSMDATVRANGYRGGMIYFAPLCSKHYARLYRYGHPTHTSEMKPYKIKRRKDRIPLEKKYNSDEGYVKVWHPTHPNARKSGYMFEHTYVMSEKIGRPLKSFENVHHLNGVRNDNRPENLELWTKSQPKGIRFSDKITQAINLLEENGYKVTGSKTCDA